jgi:hypothetical protein
VSVRDRALTKGDYQRPLLGLRERETERAFLPKPLGIPPRNLRSVDPRADGYLRDNATRYRFSERNER